MREPWFYIVTNIGIEIPDMFLHNCIMYICFYVKNFGCGLWSCSLNWNQLWFMKSTLLFNDQWYQFSWNFIFIQIFWIFKLGNLIFLRVGNSGLRIQNIYFYLPDNYRSVSSRLTYPMIHTLHYIYIDDTKF